MVKAIHSKKSFPSSKKKTTLCISINRSNSLRKGNQFKFNDINIKYSPHNTTQFLICNQVEKRKFEEDLNDEQLMIRYGTMLGKSPSKELVNSDISISTNEDDTLSDIFDCVF